MNTKTSPEILSLFENSKLFSKLTTLEINRLPDYFRIEKFQAGDVVFTEGSFSENIYIVAQGSFEIVSFNSKYQSSKQLRVLHSGEHFSELSVLTGRKHGTSAFALKESTLLCISSQSFFELMKEFPTISSNLISDISSMIQQTIENSNFIKALSEQTKIKIEPAMIPIMPLKLIQNFRCIPLRIEGNHIVVGMINPLDTRFFVEFKKINPNSEIRVVLIDEARFNSSLTKFKNLYIGNLEAQNLKQSHSVIGGNTEPLADSLPEASEIIRNNILFKKLSDSVFKQILSFVEIKSISPHAEIFSPEENSDSIYILLSGSVRLFKKNNLNGAMMPIYKLSPNEAFYDVAIFNAKEKRLTARAIGHCQICILHRKLHEHLLKAVDFSISIAISLSETLQKINSFNDGIKILDSIQLPLAYELKNFFPLQYFSEFKLMAIQQQGMELIVASTTPTNSKMTSELEKSFPRYLFKFHFCTEEKLSLWQSQIENYSQSAMAQIKSAKNGFLESKSKLMKLSHKDSIKAFDQILEKAIANQASDVHIESLERVVAVRYRIDGELIQLWENFESEIGQAIIRIAKLNAKLNLAENRLPQDGQYKFILNEKEYNLRLSSVPTKHGEKIVLRVSYKSNSIIPLKHLSREKRTVSFFNRISKHRQGIFLVVGPTGCGKSTTLYSLINEMNQPGMNLVTIEDPIEVDLPGVNQIEIQSAIGLTHDIVLRHILRQDPDIILINEIRDAASMQLAIDASMTGHLVLSTLHSSNSIDAIQRIDEIAGAKSNMLNSNLLGIVAQRLVRVLCVDCKSIRPITDLELARFKHFGKNFMSLSEMHEPTGCQSCNYTGFKGQIPCFEHWERGEFKHHQLSSEIGNSNTVRKFRNSGFESIFDYGLRMVANGLTSLQEIESNLYGIATIEENVDLENIIDNLPTKSGKAS